MNRCVFPLLMATLLCSGCGGGNDGSNSDSSSVEGLWVGRTSFVEATCADASPVSNSPRDFELTVAGPLGPEALVTVTDQTGRVYVGTGDTDLRDGFSTFASDAGNYVFSFSKIGEHSAHVTFVYGYFSPKEGSCTVTFSGDFSKA